MVDIAIAADQSNAPDHLSKMGVLLLAGGEGSRLRFDGPKGCFPISVVQKKSLFQLFAERIVAASNRVGSAIPLAIMTSERNHLETTRFFEKRGRFGLDPEQISFFQQESYPLFDDQRRPFLEEPDKIAAGANGNGKALHYLAKSGVLGEWKSRGIEHFTTLLVDNPLADPCDSRLLNFHIEQKAEVTLKCTVRTSPDEKVGIILSTPKGVRVVEYSEIEPETPHSDYANLSLFCFTVDFAERIAREVEELPLHASRKAALHLTEEGKTELSASADYWKFEHFIFDLLPYSRKSVLLLYPREEIFAPLKSADGVEEVKKALERRDREQLASITGSPIELDEPIELDPAFYYPSDQLLEQWKGRAIDQGGYITPQT